MSGMHHCMVVFSCLDVLKLFNQSSSLPYAVSMSPPKKRTRYWNGAGRGVRLDSDTETSEPTLPLS